MIDEMIAKIAHHFDIGGSFVHAKPFGTGHINDTYLALYNKAQGKIYRIIQRINHDVFKKPQELMDNFVLVTEHIRKKLKQQGTDDICRKVLKVFPASDGKYYYKDAQGNYWRALNYIDNARTYDICPSLELIVGAARAFGNFQCMLKDIHIDSLYETIPDFHNSPKRLDNFKKVASEDKRGSASGTQKEIDFIIEQSPIFDILPALVNDGRIPVRLTHNDAKINNVMFDNTSDKALCVIDLDTVMPGLSLFDFGDIVRTTITDAQEDETDLSKVTIDIARFEAILRGYLSSAGGFLNETEKKNLLISAKNIVLEQAVRFLTDHLTGDTYYKIHRPNHNLDRTRTQIRLFELIVEHQDELNKIANKITAELQKHR